MANGTQREWTPTFNPWLIAASVMLATFMEVLDTSVANVALPHIAGNLSATPEEATWVLTSYLISNAIILPATSWIGKYIGRKRFLIICIIIFTGASALCGAAPNLAILIIARILQGIGVGALELTLDLGQQRDWFESSLIVFTAVVSGTALLAFIIWELYTPEPIVNLRVFLNRNFAVGCAMIASVGVVLYGSTALLPLFLQTLLGYPAIESGFAVSPRGVGAVVS